MTPAFLAAISGIAFLDSLNPSLFVAQFYLLTTPQPIKRILSYIAGILTANFVGGLLILAGVRTLFAEVVVWLMPLMPWLQVGLGVLLWLWLWQNRQSQPAQPIATKKPRTLHPLHTYLLGIVVMGNELTTALPYFIAIERIAEANLHPLASVILLVMYNAIFALPLVAFLLLFMRFQAQFVASLEKLQRVLQRWINRILRWAALVLCAVLLLNGTMWLLTGNPAF